MLVWKRATRWAVVWAVLVAPALVLQAAHTITDVVGGALVGVLLLVPVFAIVRPREASAMTGAETEAVVDLLHRLEAGELGDPPALLAWLAGRRVELNEAELN